MRLSVRAASIEVAGILSAIKKLDANFGKCQTAEYHSESLPQPVSSLPEGHHA